MKILSIACFIAVIFVSFPVHAGAEAFPGRKLYPDVPIIELEDLYKQIEDVVVVDVRSKYEYETIRVKGALHIPVSGTRFGKDVKKLRTKTSKPIVFYCNGHTCLKSYRATRRATTAKVERSYAFDGGIFDWARAYPERTVLLGQSPINVNDLISKDKFKKHLLEPAAFKSRIGPSAIVLDVRSRLQRNAAGLFAFDEKWVSLDKTAKLDLYIDRAKKEGKQLLVYDAVGKQVRWFQYYLEKKGLKDYYFMKGGAEGYYKTVTTKP